MLDDKPIIAWDSVTVGVASLDVAISLWQGVFGMTVVSAREGPDAALAKLWGINANDISRQVILSSASSRYGNLHFVEFVNPGSPVRAGANAFDLCPKNLDIYVRDMPARVDELVAAGYKFRNKKYSEAKAPDGTRFREIQMPSHDEINVVLLELLDVQSTPADNPFHGIGPLIYIVADAAREHEFIASIFGLDKLNENILGGPEIEKMVGLPSGAVLDVSIWGRAGQAMGQLEVIDYQGVDGANLYPSAKAPATGVLHLNFSVANLAPLIERLEQHGETYTEYASDVTLHGQGRTLTFATPTGLRIEVRELSE